MLSVKRKGGGGVSLPKRLNVNHLQASEVRQNLVDKMDALVIENNCTSFKEAVYKACADVVGFT